MQQTIANQHYDTDTAQAIGNWQRGYSSEKGYISETLYHTPEGAYFLHGEGGPRSRYAQRVGPNTWGYGERIIPISEDEAHAWAENHMTESAYDKLYGTNAHAESLTTVMVRLKTATAQKLDDAARSLGRQPSDLAEELIAKGLSDA